MKTLSAVLLVLAILPQATTGVITGVVTVDGTSEGISGVKITILPIGGMAFRPVAQATTTTDANGRFSVSVPPNPYWVRAEKIGYTGDERGGRFGPGASPLFSQRQATVGANASVAVALGLKPSGAVTGQVTDTRGRPRSGILIDPLNMVSKSGQTLLVPDGGRQTTTDDRGMFRISGLKGRYYLRARVTSPNETRGVTTYYPKATDASAAVAISVDGGGDMSGIDIVLQDTPTVRVSGSVTGPQETSLVELYVIRQGTVVEPPLRLSQSIDPARGEFLINLLPGAYDVFPIVKDARGASFTAPNKVVVGAQGIQGVKLSIPAYSRLAGKVEAEAGVLTRPVQIRLEPSALLPAQQWPPNVNFTASVNATGEFAFDPLPQGNYRIGTSALPLDAYVADIRQSSRSLLGNAIVAVGSSSEKVDISVRSGGATLQINVLADPPSAAGNAAIIVLPALASKRTSIISTRTGAADDKGRAAFINLPPGEYKVFAFQDAPEPLPSAETLIAPYEHLGRVVNLAAGSRASEEIRAVRLSR